MVKLRIVSVIIILCVLVSISVDVFAASPYEIVPEGKPGEVTSSKIKQIESLVEDEMSSGKIPGLELVIVKGDETLYQKGFGYANINQKKPVANESIFELGSNSKAFTALGILLLRDQGRINLDDPVKKYIPWFSMKYKGEETNITIHNLLHHTSGIPHDSIGDIPEAEGDDALEKTVRTLLGRELVRKPGEKYEYVTMGYDILGLVIQNVSGQLFETFMKDNVLKPLGLNNTYLYRDEAVAHGIATGYKLSFLQQREYVAPIYRGSTPCGYFMTNGNDLARWMKIQMGTIDISPFNKALIEETHIPDRTVPPATDGSIEGCSYAEGWFVYQTGGGEISHRGGNPNYTSFIVFRPEEKLSIAVMANTHSELTRDIGQGALDLIMEREEMQLINRDIYRDYDRVASSIVFVVVPLSLIILFFLMYSIWELIKGKRHFVGFSVKGIVAFIASLIFMCIYCYAIYKIPDLLLNGFSYKFFIVWLSISITIAMVSILVAGILLYLYLLFTFVFPKPNEKPLFTIITVGAISGLGNAILIFVINQSFNSTDNIENGLLMYFFIGLAVYIIGQRLIRTRLIRLTNNIVYDKRMNLINRILSAPFHKLEKIEQGKLHACLNNDTEVISSYINIIVTGATNAITLIFCFVYLGIINFYGFLVSFIVIIFAAVLYYLVGRSANKLWQQTRNIQNVFFKYIDNLIGGFKELYLNNIKKNEFKDDVEVCCNEYNEKRSKGDLKFANVFIAGELLFIFVIGIAVFVFPFIFDDLKDNTLRNYVFIFLYMGGPVRAILSAIPNIVQVKISWSRINEIISEVSAISSEENNKIAEPVGSKISSLELKDVSFQYKNQSNEDFKIGPVNFKINAGEIVFITGGNGSGKTTLSKLITGLYEPENGEIIIDGRKVSYAELGQYFSAIFSDYYLFDKLYGIDCDIKKDEIEEYLRILHIDNKVMVTDNSFSTTRLSTGQRKRLALLISYLDDRPVYLFDEWAAEQDSEFRNYFYLNLLPQLRDKGKCIIAITHDDRYFNTADKIIKMDMGMVVSDNECNKKVIDNVLLT